MRKKRYPFKVMLHATIRNDDFERIVPYNITFMISELCCKSVKVLNPGVISKVEFDRPGERSPE